MRLTPTRNSSLVQVCVCVCGTAPMADLRSRIVVLGMTRVSGRTLNSSSVRPYFFALDRFGLLSAAIRSLPRRLPAVQRQG